MPDLLSLSWTRSVRGSCVRPRSVLRRRSSNEEGSIQTKCYINYVLPSSVTRQYCFNRYPIDLFTCVRRSRPQYARLRPDEPIPDTDDGSVDTHQCAGPDLPRAPSRHVFPSLHDMSSSVRRLSCVFVRQETRRGGRLSRRTHK